MGEGSWAEKAHVLSSKEASLWMQMLSLSFQNAAGSVWAKPVKEKGERVKIEKVKDEADKAVEKMSEAKRAIKLRVPELQAWADCAAQSSLAQDSSFEIILDTTHKSNPEGKHHYRYPKPNSYNIVFIRRTWATPWRRRSSP